MTDIAPIPVPPTRFWKRVGMLALMLLTLLSFSPLIALVLAGTTASVLGCQVDEGSVHSCYLGGVDIGRTLSTGVVMAWFMFVTWPGVLVSLGLWVFVIVRWASRPRG